MHFTEEQEKKIFSNLDAIIDYIEREIQSQLLDGECIEIEFRSNNDRNRCKMNINDSYVTGFVGFTGVTFKTEKSSAYSSVYDSVDHAAEFVLNWNDSVPFASNGIKSKILMELNMIIAERKRINNIIDNFEV
jgi:hypothetical protein